MNKDDLEQYVAEREELEPGFADLVEKTQQKRNNMFIVRLWDMFDGWIDATGPVSEDEAKRRWNEFTNNGTKNTEYKDGDYYKIFPANTKMLVTPEYLGR